MRRIAPIAVLLVLTIAARAQTQIDPDAWTPGAALLEDLDSQAVQLQLRGASGALDGYERYYRGTKKSGRLFVEGYFGPFRTEGRIADAEDLPSHVHIVTRAAPSVANAGCQVVFLVFDVGDNSFTSIQCEPEAPPARP